MIVAAIVPAAGASVRMGRPKLLIEFDGRPLIAKVVTTLFEAGIDRVVVVAPPSEAPEGPEIASVAERAGAIVIIPSSRPAAMRDSIELGLQDLGRLATTPAGVLVQPADSPRIDASLVSLVIDSWRLHPDRIAVAAFEGRRGHPIILPWRLACSIRELPADVGMNRLLNVHADKIELTPAENDSILYDLDTPDDLRALGVRTVRLFAVARERAGRSEVEVMLPPPAKVGDLRRALADQHPALANLAASVRIAVDDEYAADEAPLPPSCRLALIPPVSGGVR